MIKRSYEEKSKLFVDYVNSHPGCTIDEVHSAFPEYKRKTVKNILFDLDCDRVIRRTVEQPGLGPQVSRAWPLSFGV